MATNSVLAKLAVNISANTAQFNQSLSKTQKDLSSFTGGITKLAGALGVAFGTQQIASFAIEVTRLAGQAEAVGNAFERLPNSARLMGELKRATGGTVSELELMKRAVQASNFDIELSQLPKLLEFATLRAQQSGQSVDYLVDSIVTGIGRKSKLILDNLGISAVQLTEALGGASAMSSSIGDVTKAVGSIADKALNNMAAFAENADTKIQRLSASWDDLKTSIGEAANNSDLLNDSLNVTAKIMRAFAGDELQLGINELMARSLEGSDRLNKLAAEGVDISLSWQELLQRRYVATELAAKKVAKVLEEIAEHQKNMRLANVTVDPLTGVPSTGLTPWDPSMIQKQVVSLNSLKEKEKELLEQFGEIDDADQKRQESKAAEIKLIREQIKAIEDLLKVEDDVIKLSITAQRALKGDSLKKVSTFGELITKITPFGGVLQNFKGVAGEKTPLSDAIPVDLEKMAAAAQAMVNLRNESLKTKTEMVQHWIDLSGTITGALGNIAEGLGGAIVGVENFGETIINAFIGFAKEFGAMLLASGIAAMSLKFLVKNPGLAIAAGAGLLAVAGAAQAAFQKSHSGFMGGGSSAPGRLPSETTRSESRIRGYDIYINQTKDGYRRSRVG